MALSILVVIISLPEPVGILKRILSSDWLPKRVKYAHHACSGLHGLIPRKKEIAWGELTREFVSFEQFQQQSRKKR